MFNEIYVTRVINTIVTEITRITEYSIKSNKKNMTCFYLVNNQHKIKSVIFLLET